MASINKLILEKGQENFVHEKEMSKTTSFLFLPLVIQNRSEKLKILFFITNFSFKCNFMFTLFSLVSL